jgi:hypothetical protein
VEDSFLLDNAVYMEFSRCCCVYFKSMERIVAFGCETFSPYSCIKKTIRKLF